MLFPEYVDERTGRRVIADDAAGAVLFVDPGTGEVVASRPYTPDEVAIVSTEAREEMEAEHAATLRAAISTNLDALQGAIDGLNEITNRTNADINGNPARAIKDAVRETLTVARQTVRVARIVAGVLDDPPA